MILTAEQKAERRKSLGGSDAAAAVNLSPWCSPYRLWLEKTGQQERDEDEEARNADAKHFGNVLETIVATEFARRTGIKVARVNRALRHPENTFMTANIDRRLVGVREGLECKTASAFVAHHWGDTSDQVPIQYLIQCMHYLAVTGWDAWHIAVIVGGNSFRSFRIARDEDMIADLCSREREFWHCVQTGTPPEMKTLDDAFLRWPKDYGTPIVASPNARRAYDRLIELRAKLKEVEADIDAECLKVQTWMGDHSVLLDVDGATPLVSWKSQVTNRIDVEALRTNHPDIAKSCTYQTPSRVFRYLGKRK